MSNGKSQYAGFVPAPARTRQNGIIEASSTILHPQLASQQEQTSPPRPSFLSQGFPRISIWARLLQNPYPLSPHAPRLLPNTSRDRVVDKSSFRIDS
ncbi:hypothetical protein BO70DRAFT_393307 [Aspergillus heteromorphus CBS 117.55]|uniref:Uncharacterized protein n=1 Tax=Aspergillus heteromorphus CBS 117.55 TaxID=1448321 RepID=A0A317X0S7_9EURO|nr:uncharacterized protein BO70DRAFT_393307 [Aspergillus heteromorphus CBS 117.55]PWY90120.1 hypothetical protein BO70DRAFT_393307 [Aspergillus heteromorphus CBS 117.55]